MASYNKPDERLSDSELADIINRAVPPYAYRTNTEWTWTRPAGVWKINTAHREDFTGMILKARLESAASIPQMIVESTRRQVNAALRWLVLVDAIDRHPDDPIPMEKSDHA